MTRLGHGLPTFVVLHNGPHKWYPRSSFQGCGTREQMAIHLRRREIIAGLGSMPAAAWPIGSTAQQSTKKIRSLGLLLPGLPEASMGKAIRDRLRELGYAEGRDIIF